MLILRGQNTVSQGNSFTNTSLGNKRLVDVDLGPCSHPFIPLLYNMHHIWPFLCRLGSWPLFPMIMMIDSLFLATIEAPAWNAGAPSCGTPLPFTFTSRLTRCRKVSVDVSASHSTCSLPTRPHHHSFLSWHWRQSVEKAWCLGGSSTCMLSASRRGKSTARQPSKIPLSTPQHPLP